MVESRIMCFHNPEERNGYLSNWYMSGFRAGALTFSSMEQYMMYSKACLFGDRSAAERIIHIDDVRQIKALGRMVKGYSDRKWKAEREEIVKDGLRCKFGQNEDLKKRLIGTGDKILAECAVKDTIWGIGLSMHDERRFDIKQWRGQNLLGKCLMAVRSELQSSEN